MSNPKSGIKKIWKWIAGIMLFLFALIAGISIYFSIHWKPQLRDKIKEVVKNGSGGLYQIDFKDIHLNIMTGSVTVDSILLSPDTAVFHQQVRDSIAPGHLYQVKLETLRLRRISVLTIYFKKKIEMDDIILDHPSINMIYNKVYRKPVPKKDRRSLYDRIAKNLNSVHIEGIKIRDADFDYISGSTGRILNSVKHLNVQVDDFLLDKNSRTDTTRFYYTKDISFELAGYSALSKDKMYTTKIDTITGSAARKSLSIRGLRMIPMYPELQFSRMLKTQKDRYDLNFKRIDFRGVNFYRLNRRGVLYARSLTIDDAVAKIFMNREMPPGHGNKTRNFPHMALRRLPVETTIDTFKLKRINVAYTEYNPMSQEKGVINIDRLNGNILNVTNDPVTLAKNDHAIADLEAYMVKAAQLKIHINFDLKAPDAAFTFHGNIGKMDMVKLNPLSKALGMLKVESGNIHKIDFDVRANEKGSMGTMHLYYDNLKIALLKEGEDGQPAKKKGFLSFLANNLIVKDANPDKGKPLRTANIVFERPPGASFFNLLWKSVFIGMRETVGLGIVPMKSPEEGRKAVVKKMEERREKRQSRKEKRQQKRARKAEEKAQRNS